MRRSAELIREARLRAGLTQHELAERTGRDRSVIARWEQGGAAPSVETVVELVRACGFDLPLELAALDPAPGRRLRRNALLSPERRLARTAGPRHDRKPAPAASSPPFDPYAILAALEHHRVAYVLIGAFARVIEGTEELTHGVDLAPSTRAGNLRRLASALADLDARHPDGSDLAFEQDLARGPVLELLSSAGELKIVPEPEGTRGGYNDLRRAAAREPLGHGLRPQVASIGDLARMSAALGREQDLEPLRQLRILAELEHSLHRGIEP
jgi:transcriptional regulator with XRE-family HTH domain